MNPIRYMGIDGCRGSWFYAGLDEKNKWRFGIFPRIRKLLEFDDIIHAMAGAVTAKYHQNFLSLPADPELDSEGLLMEIVYALPV